MRIVQPLTFVDRVCCQRQGESLVGAFEAMICASSMLEITQRTRETWFQPSVRGGSRSTTWYTVLSAGCSPKQCRHSLSAIFTTTLCIVFLEPAKATRAAGLETIGGVGSRLALSFALLLSCCSCPHLGEGSSWTNKARVLCFLGLVAPRCARLALLCNHIEVCANRTVDCKRENHFLIVGPLKRDRPRNGNLAMGI